MEEKSIYLFVKEGLNINLNLIKLVILWYKLMVDKWVYIKV